MNLDAQGEYYATKSGAISLLSGHSGWRDYWTQIIPGNFITPYRSHLFFYSSSSGEALLCNSGKQTTIVKEYSGWRKTWGQIIPGRFNVDSDNYGNYIADLLFYDPDAGVGAFFEISANGDLTLLREYTGWRKSWKIIPGKFYGEIYATPSTDLLFYDPTTGESEFYKMGDKCQMTLFRQYSGWRKTWSQVIPGHWGNNALTDLFFYDPTTGEGESYVMSGDGQITLLRKYPGLSKTWSLIISGFFGGHSTGLMGYYLKNTDLFFYDTSEGLGQFFVIDDRGYMRLLSQYGMRKSWSQIITGNFGSGGKVYPPTKVGSDKITQDLLFYDPVTSVSS